jgi:cell division protein FtsI/penicillin-binding protein 2
LQIKSNIILDVYIIRKNQLFLLFLKKYSKFLKNMCYNKWKVQKGLIFKMPATPLRLRKRVTIFSLVLIFVLILLSGRIGWIQFVEGQKLSAQIKDQLRENRTTYSPRGTIYDRNGRQLAVSHLAKSLYANPEQIKNPQDLAQKLAPVLDRPADVIAKRLSGPGTFVWLGRKLEREQYDEIASFIKENNIRGLYFLEESKRHYPNKSMLAQVLGFVGTDDMGLEGLEASLDKVIKGERRQQLIKTDNQGVPILESIFSYMPRDEKVSVYLTIDSVIQYITEKALDKAMAQTKANAAIAIVINPKTGEILAMANKPAYDPNFFHRYQPQTWRNNSVALNYEPGSTFKVIIAAAAMEEGILRAESRFIDRGHVEVSGRRIKNWNDESYGDVSFNEVMKHSINTSFVQLGLQMGSAKLDDYVKRFGFGQTTGIELYGEESGILFNPREMRYSDIATMSIGQSIAVTPIQLVCAVGAIANDGVLLKPSIIRNYHSYDGKTEMVFAEQSVRQVIKPEVAKSLTAIMENVVNEGGAFRAVVPGYRFAGKTGTAEKIKENGSGYEEGRYIASFAGFGPVEDPRFAALIILDDPDGQFYGGQVAAPVFSEIMSQIMIYENVHNKESLEAFQRMISEGRELELR